MGWYMNLKMKSKLLLGFSATAALTLVVGIGGMLSLCRLIGHPSTDSSCSDLEVLGL